MEHPVRNESIEYNDNRLALYCAQQGKCAITGRSLEIGDIHCHHKVRRADGGDDSYSNLVLVCRDAHILLHAMWESTIEYSKEKYKNNLAEALRPPPLCFYACSNGSPQSPQITLTSRVARIMVPQQGQTYLILRFLDFLLPPYLTITAFSIPAIAVCEAGAATFRAMSNSQITMWISLMMNMINVTGNAIFIYGAGMATGVTAVSTLLSRVAAAVVV